MHRLFVAIRPPDLVRDLLIDAMDDSPALRSPRLARKSASPNERYIVYLSG